jgi:hypothetical protein
MSLLTICIFLFTYDDGLEFLGEVDLAECCEQQQKG